MPKDTSAGEAGAVIRRRHDSPRRTAGTRLGEPPGPRPAEGLPAPPPDPLRLLRHRVRRSRERVDREAHHDPRASRLRQRCHRLRRRRLLPGLLPPRDPGHAHRREVERPTLDRTHHGHLGRHGRAHRHRPDPVRVLPRAVPAGAGGGRLLSRGDRLPHPLVPEPRPGARLVVLLRGDAGRAAREPEDLEPPLAHRHRRGRGRDARPPREGARPLGLAVGLRRLGHPGGRDGRRRPLLPDRPATAGPVARARGAGSARGRAGAREGGRVREAPDDVGRGSSPPEGAPARARVLPLGDRQLRRRVLPAQHPRAVVLPQVRHPHLDHPPAAAPRRRRPAVRGLELGPDEGAAAAHGRSDGRLRSGPPGRDAEPRAPPAHRGLLHGRVRRLQGLPARVLGDAEPLPDGGRGRGEHRPHQLDRQPRAASSGRG